MNVIHFVITTKKKKNDRGGKIKTERFFFYSENL